MRNTENNPTKILDVVVGIVDNLKKELKPVANALKEIETINDRDKESDNLLKLPKMVGILTAVSKRKSLKALIGKEGIGLNNNGLGRLNGGTQLTPLNQRWNSQKHIIFLMDVFKDDEAVLEIADEITQKNRKDFLRLASHFKKNPVVYLEESSEEVTPILSLDFDDYGKVEILIDGDKTGWRLDDIINGNSNIDYGDFEIKNILDAEHLTENKNALVMPLLKHITKLKTKIASDKLNADFVWNMIKPIEAMESL